MILIPVICKLYEVFVFYSRYGSCRLFDCDIVVAGGKGIHRQLGGKKDKDFGKEYRAKVRTVS